jgi:hypothetical protein
MMRFVTTDGAASSHATALGDNIYRKSTRTVAMDSTSTRFGTTEIQSKGVISSWSFVGIGASGERARAAIPELRGAEDASSET